MENPITAQSSLSTLIGDTRGRLLALLRRGRLSIADLAAALGVTDNAVRMHIAALERDGWVAAAGVRRDTGGKPSRLYDLTDRAEELFPKAYSVILNALLEAVEERDGREGLVALLRAVGAKAGSTQGSSPDDVEDKVRAAADALRELGGDVEIERIAGGWKLCGNGCPLSSIVTEHEAACQLVEELIAQITGRPVREECNRVGRPRCTFRVESA